MLFHIVEVVLEEDVSLLVQFQIEYYSLKNQILFHSTNRTHFKIQLLSNDFVSPFVVLLETIFTRPVSLLKDKDT